MSVQLNHEATAFFFERLFQELHWDRLGLKCKAKLQRNGLFHFWVLPADFEAWSEAVLEQAGDQGGSPAQHNGADSEAKVA